MSLSLKCLSVSVMTVALMTALMHHNAAAESLTPEYKRKTDHVMQLWGVEHQEFIRETHLNAREKEDLRRLLLSGNVRDERTRRGTALLLALNCVTVPAEATPYLTLERYRCAHGDFEELRQAAVTSLDGIYMLAFVKEDDALRTVRFLDRYINFWKDESKLGDGMPLETSDREYLFEIKAFLVRGGYRQQKE